MYLLLVFLPLISFCVAGLFGKQLGSNGSALLTVSCLFFSFLYSIISFYEVALMGGFVYINWNTWISVDVFHVDWGFMFDSLSVSMCCVVTFISLLVHVYSVEYMSHDPHLPRFMSYLSLFTFFMLILVTADNFMQMFVGWEGVGLCSYLLINFWFTRIQANKAAIKAMVINRLGDFGLVLGILVLFVSYKSTDYATIASLTPFLKEETISFLNTEINTLWLISFFLFIGVIGKSAQFGLHTWLPDAMEGPTPVSALIHAATMVTAGVFLLVRSSFLYEYSQDFLEYVTIIGSVTAFLASSIGLVQNDMKRVIAYSTCSQLGYMVFACGLSSYSAGFFHLTNHAFFKALLFLCAGSVIHALKDEQDMRKMGGLKNLVPLTYSMMFIGSLALTGFPFLTGFYSKDLILELAFGNYSLKGYFSYYLGTVGAFLTSFYSIRLVFLTFLLKPNGYRTVICSTYEHFNLIPLTLCVLAVPSIFAGFYTKDLIVGLGSEFFGSSVFISPRSFNWFDAEVIPFSYKSAPLVMSFLGLVSGGLFFGYYNKVIFKFKLSRFGRATYNFLNRKWFFDKIINEVFAQGLFKSGYSVSYKFVDRGVLEIVGPTGLSVLTRNLAINLQNLQTGQLYHYTVTVLIGLTLMLGFKNCYTMLGPLHDFRLFCWFFISIFFIINFEDDHSVDIAQLAER